MRRALSLRGKMNLLIGWTFIFCNFPDKFFNLPMAKLKNIVKQLSDKDYKAIYDQLMKAKSDKSAYLLKALRERRLTDGVVMKELDLNPNAYYTMRSRLNQKIEGHLIHRMESPRADIIKKVVNINEVLFTQNRTICIATLKKMEKELIDYDLANELTAIYKSLKKLHVNSPEHFQYSQAYNRHVAYMLAVDKAEDLLADYFKKYGEFLLTGDDGLKLSLGMLMTEMQNVSKLYESHRLYVFLSCMRVFHKLFVDRGERESDTESIQDSFAKVEKIFTEYNLDSLYYHLDVVFEFLRFGYLTTYKIYKEAEKYFDEVNEASSNLLTNYPSYTFAPQLLILKLQRALRNDAEASLYPENEELFSDYEANPHDNPSLIVYAVYRSLCAYYVGKYEEAAKILQDLMTEVTLKNYPLAQIEIKGLLALYYCLLKEVELFNQLFNSLQRHIRLIGKDACENVMLLLKILKTALSEAKHDKPEKISAIIPKFQSAKVNYFSPTGLIRMDEKFVDELTAIEV
jgi:hypothetical protein